MATSESSGTSGGEGAGDTTPGGRRRGNKRQSIGSVSFGALTVAALSGAFLAASVGVAMHCGYKATIAMVIGALYFIVVACPPEDEVRSITWLFRFAYAFTVFAFMALLAPWLGPDRGQLPSAPIHLIRGCYVEAYPANSVVTGLVSCPKPKDSEATKHEPSAGPAETTYADEADGGRPTTPSETPAQRPVPGVRLNDAGVPTGGGNASKGGRDQDTNDPPPNSIIDPDVKRLPLLLAIGGAIEAQAQRDGATLSIVRGGLVVPFFIVIVAFMGGAISLSRKVPEYQKRNAAGYVGTDQQPALSDEEAREYVLFQILQLVSAPLIAIVAYHALDPQSMGAAIGLAFVSGFASQAILLQIRRLSDAISLPTERTASRRLTGKVVDSSGKPVKGAEVTLKNGSGASARTDKTGRFTFTNMPDGEYEIGVNLSDKGEGVTKVEVKGRDVPDVVVTVKKPPTD